MQTEKAAKDVYTRLSIYIEAVLARPDHHLLYVERLWTLYKERNAWFTTLKKDRKFAIFYETTVAANKIMADHKQVMEGLQKSCKSDAERDAFHHYTDAPGYKRALWEHDNCYNDEAVAPPPPPNYVQTL